MTNLKIIMEISTYQFFKVLWINYNMILIFLITNQNLKK